jgi:hypothetical protein
MFNFLISVFLKIINVFSFARGRVLVGKPEGKRPLGKPRRRWEDNIKADLQKVGCMVWTGLNWLRIEKGDWYL